MVRKVARNRTGNEWRQGSCSFWPFGGGGRVLPPPFYFLSSSINPETCNFSQHSTPSFRTSIGGKKGKGWTMDYRGGCEEGLGPGRWILLPPFSEISVKMIGRRLNFVWRTFIFISTELGDKMNPRLREPETRLFAHPCTIASRETREIRLEALYATRGN